MLTLEISFSGTGMTTFNTSVVTNFTTGIPGAAFCPTSPLFSETIPSQGA